jgi:hypothetical protein
MSFLGRLFLGTGKLPPPVRAALEAEGLLAIEEGVSGRIGYTRFKAPGKHFHGKVTWERLALALSERRFVVYCRSGRAELIDSPYSSSGWDMVELAAEEDDRLVIRVDYDRDSAPEVSGQVAITARTKRAAEIADQVHRRIATASA